MTDKDLIKQLNSLKAITPEDGYARNSRFIILSSGETNKRVTTKYGFFARSFNFASSVAMVAVFLFVLTIGGISGALKGFFLPNLEGVDNQSLLTEADIITSDIDIKLRDIQYFAEDDTVALAEGEKSFTQTVDFTDSEEEIDQLLDEVIEY